jgi:hypothetical protein
MDLHCTFQLSNEDTKSTTRILQSITTAKASLVFDMLSEEYMFRWTTPSLNSAIGNADLIKGLLVTKIIPSRFLASRDYFKLTLALSPLSFFTESGLDATGWRLDAFVTAEIHLIENIDEEFILE